MGWIFPLEQVEGQDVASPFDEKAVIFDILSAVSILVRRIDASNSRGIGYSRHMILRES